MGCSLLAGYQSSELWLRRFDSCLPSVEQYEARYIELLQNLYSNQGDTYSDIVALRQHQQLISAEHGNDVLARLLNKYGE